MSDTQDPSEKGPDVDKPTEQQIFEIRLKAHVAISEKELFKRMNHVENLVLDYAQRLLTFEKRLNDLEQAELNRRQQQNFLNGRQ